MCASFQVIWTWFPQLSNNVCRPLWRCLLHLLQIKCTCACASSTARPCTCTLASFRASLDRLHQLCSMPISTFGRVYLTCVEAALGQPLEGNLVASAIGWVAGGRGARCLLAGCLPVWVGSPQFL